MSATYPRVVVLAGATATGKTAVGELLADALGAEVVCGDSRQVYRELEIGTGKPVPAERAQHPHHLFDALDLGARASAGWYARACRDTLRAIAARGSQALIVGGSGLYLRAAGEGLAPEPPRDAAVRERLAVELAASGPEPLHARLRAVDPESAARLAPRDRQRVVRALEVFESSGRPLSWWHARPAPAGADAHPWHMVELTATPETLDARIARRTRAMFEVGLLDETRALLAAGRREALLALRAVGYDEAVAFLEGRLDLDAAMARTTLRTRQLAKRQRTWFRHQLEGRRIATEERDAASLAGEIAAWVGRLTP